MWIGKAHYRTLDGLINSAQERNTEMLRREGAVNQKVADLERMNAQLVATVEWMKIRLNSVERERAVLISAAIGIKVPVPEFMPVTGDADMQKTFSEMPNLSTVGEDAEEEATPVDYSQLPGYRAQK